MVWLSWLSVFSQTDGYDPANPPLPDFPNTEQPADYYRLTVKSSPAGNGIVSTSGGSYQEGQSVGVSAYNRDNMVFQYWMDDEGNELSTSRHYTYTMPKRDAVLTAVFKYEPASPSLPDFPENAKTYTLSLACKPAGAGSFNVSSRQLAADASVRLYAYTNSNFRFVYWADAKGDTVSTAQNFYFTMPAADTQLYGMYKYEPGNPKNPGANSYDSFTGEVIVDDFTPGNLNSAIQEVTGNSTSNITKLTVAGQISVYDFSIANNYPACAVVDLSRTSGVTNVPSYCYSSNTHLSRLLLPASIVRIESYAFSKATALAELTCMSAVPPTLGNGVFNEVTKGLVVFVPKSSVDIYEAADGWKNYVADGTIVIMPVQKNVASLEVNLPDECRDGRYKNMTLELVNVKSGQKYRYVITDRLNYTFSTLMRDTRYSAYLKNSLGAVLAQIDAIEMQGENQSVTFDLTQMKQLRTVVARVMAGTDATADCTVTWLDANGTFLAQGQQLTGQVAGTQLKCKIALQQSLGMQYVQPEDMSYEVVEGDNELVVNLAPLPRITLRGKVVDRQTQLGVSGATVTVSQTLNGKYSKAFTAKTDSRGEYVVEAFAAPSVITYAVGDYVSVTNDLPSDLLSQTEATLADVLLKPVAGVTITTNFTYRKSVAETVEPEVADFYSDYSNIAYTIYDETARRDIRQFNVQYPNIVLLEDVGEGDELTIVAHSKTGAFMDVTAKGIVGSDNRMAVTIPIVQLGGINASFTTTENSRVLGILYDAGGNLVSKYNYGSSSLLISDLKDGDYTLVTMGESEFFGSIYNMEQFGQAGLVSAVDYVANKVTVRSGVITPVKNAVVPFFDESKYYYTGSNTSFTVNKNSIVAGNYLTMTARVDFKSVYSDNVSDVKLRVELPKGTKLVDNSVMVGSTMAYYETTDNAVVIPLDNNSISDRVRFCVIPTESGNYAPNATVAFTLKNKQMQQPIGSAQYVVQDIAITVPSEINTPELVISGVAAGGSNVAIYANENIIGTVRALANGYWQLSSALPNPYNLEEFNVYAKITSKDGLVMQTETKQCVYNEDYVVAKSVEMSFYNAYLRKNISVVFDLENAKVSDNSYMFYTGTDVTFTANLTNNDTTMVNGVKIRVYTDKGEWVNLQTRYNKNIDRWVATQRFESNNLPIGVKVDVDVPGKTRMDVREISSYVQALKDSYDNVAVLKSQLDSVEKECQEIDSDNKATSESLKKIISNFYGEVSTEIADKLIDEFLEKADIDVAGHDTDLNSMTLDELLANGEILLDGDRYSPEAVDELVDETNALLNGYSVLDWSRFFDQQTDTISFVDGNGVKRVFCRKLRGDFDFSVFSDDETIKLPTTEDGTELTLYYSGDNIVLDNPKDQYVWTIVSPEAADIAKTIRRISGEDVVAALHEACNLVKTTVDAIFEKVDELVEPIKEEIASMEKQVASLSDKYDDLLAKSASKGMKLRDVERQIKALEHQVGYVYNDPATVEYQKCWTQKIRLEDERKQLLDELESITGQKKTLQSAIKRSKSNLLVKAALLGEVLQYYDLGKQLLSIVKYGYNGIADMMRWNRFIDSILPCENDKSNALALVDRSKNDRNKLGWKYASSLSLSAISATINGIMTFNPAAKAAKFIVKSLVGVISGFVENVAGKIYNETRVQSKNYLKNRRGEKRKLKCNEKKDDDDDDDDDDNPPYPIITPIHDPSGFVYEGVSSNRLPGVTATCYYKETVEDMYGDLHENIVLWNAEEYAQKNPLFTDENGMYQWDVPQGLWQVKFEKEGYATTQSEWLPVPPPQMDVNIAMVQNSQPEVVNARAYEDGVEIEFSKYMDIESLNKDNVYLKVVSEGVETLVDDATVEMINEEAAIEGSETHYASKMRLATDKLAYYDEAYVVVSRNVRSYAGICMAEDFLQKLDVEKKVREILVDKNLNVAYGGETVVQVAAQPAEAAAGKTLLVSMASQLIASADAESLTLDADGHASFTLKGELLGTTAINYTLSDIGMEATTLVNVVDPALLVAVKAPRASRISGTAVYRGQTVALTCESDGATIYYTTDGSCPCEEAGRMKYERPIVINDAMTIKAMAVGVQADESEVCTYEYTIRQSDVRLNLAAGWNWNSHDLAAPLEVNELDGLVTRILTQTQEAIADDNLGLVGNLHSVDAAEAMKLMAAEPAVKSFTGEQYNPASASVYLRKGWNWLGYPVSTELTLADALSMLEAEENDCIENLDGGFATFTEGVWTGTLETLQPGRGYLYKSASDKTFVYNTVPSVASAKALYGHRLDIKEAPCTVNKHMYPNMMPMIVSVEGGTAMPTEGSSFIVAMSGGECRGVVRLDGEVSYLSVYGNGDEAMTFVVVDMTKGETYAAKESVAFVADMIGTAKSPYTLHLCEPTGIEGVVDEGNATDGIYGVNGVRISKVTQPGVYIIKTTDGDGTTTIRKRVVK